MAINHLVFILMLSCILFSAMAFPSSTISTAIDILSSSGYLSMALTLQISSRSLDPDTSIATVFAPWDSAFVKSGQPSLLDLLYHMSPIRLTMDDMKALTFGSRIPTLSPNRYLIVTTPSGFNSQLSINGVPVQESMIFYSGSLLVYGINEFFNSSFQIPGNFAPVPCPSPSSSSTTDFLNASLLEQSQEFDFYGAFSSAAGVLMFRGYSVMATFLDVQLSGLGNSKGLTLFAAADLAMESYAKNVSDYVLIFRRHAVPRLYPWQDLIGLEHETALPTFSRGFSINVTRSEDVVLVNGVQVIFQDMFRSDRIVVHGVNQLLMLATNEDKMGMNSFPEFDQEDEQRLNGDYNEYGFQAP